jgi:hypothetical protein
MPSITITTIAAAVATLAISRRQARPTVKLVPTASAGRMSGTRAAARPSSPAASLQWMSPTTGAFGPAGRRQLELWAS